MSVFPKRPGGASSESSVSSAAVAAKSYQHGLPWSQRKLLATPGSFNFTVPDGITKLRAIAIGAGGAGGCFDGSSYLAGAGAGGGYAEKVYDVTAGQIASIVVGAGGATYAANGGTSSVTVNSVAISATGGAGGAANANAAGGVGTGGDINFSGGVGARCWASSAWPGGGAAGSPLGNGGYCSLTNLGWSLGGAGIGGFENKGAGGGGSHGPSTPTDRSGSSGGPGVSNQGGRYGFNGNYNILPPENGIGGNWWDLHDIEGSGAGSNGNLSAAGARGGPGGGGSVGVNSTRSGNGGLLGGGAGAATSGYAAGSGGPGGGGGSCGSMAEFGLGGPGIVILYW